MSIITWTKPKLSARTLAALELVLLLFALEWCLWTDNRQVLSRPARSAGHVVLVAVVTLLLARGPRDLHALGLAPTSWYAGLPILFLGTLGALAGIALVGMAWGTIGNIDHLPRWIGRNAPIDLVQQILLQVLLWPRLARLLPNTANPALVSALAALIFALLHLPNSPLTLLTLVAGFFWCEWFRRFRNLPALFLSHLVLASGVLYCLNGPALFRLRVGINYWLASA